MKKIRVKWYSGDGVYRGSEVTTVGELEERLKGKAIVVEGNGVRVWRLATGEVARVRI